MSSRIQHAIRLTLLICLLCLVCTRSYRIRSQSKLSMSLNFKSNDLAIVALSLGLTISNPYVSFAADIGKTAASTSLITKSKVLVVEPIDLNEVKSARVKPLYEEIKYNKVLNEKNSIKRAFDLASRSLIDSKSDLNSAQLVLKKYENQINQVDRLIRSAKDSKDTQKLYKEQGDLRNSVVKGRRLINNLQAFIKKTSQDLQSLDKQLKESEKTVERCKEAVALRKNELMKEQQLQVQRKLQLEKENEKKILNQNIVDAQKSLEAARKNTMKSKSLEAKLRKDKADAISNGNKLKSAKLIAQKHLRELMEELENAKASLLEIETSEVANNSKLSQLDRDVEQASISIRANEAAISSATDLYNHAKSSLK